MLVSEKAFTLKKNWVFPKYCTDFDARMLWANSDKSRIIEFVSPPRVADLGTGTGNLINLLQKIPDAQVVGFDSNEEHLLLARKSHPNVKFYKRNLLDASSFKPFYKCFDTAIMSSVLHEIEWPHGNAKSKKVFQLIKKLLKNNGIFIFRDGVKPETSLEKVEIKFMSDYGWVKFNRFIQDFKPRKIDAQIVNGVNRKALLSYYDLHDFLCKYYFEGVMWKNDMNQVFGIRKPSEYKEIFANEFDIISIETYIAPYLQSLWKTDFEILSGAFPDSHIMIVAKNSSTSEKDTFCKMKTV